MNIQNPTKNPLRSITRISLLLLASVLPPLIAAGSTLHSRFRGAFDAPTVPALVTPDQEVEFDPTLRTAVVLTGNGGAETSDFLMPFETLATSRAFNLYVLAPKRKLVPLANAATRDGGLELLPHFGLADYDRSIGRSPDIIVIPYIPTFASGEENALLPWIEKHARNGSLVVSVCAGAEVLAATGLIDGLEATSHPSFLERFERTRPQVKWVRDRRYVENPIAISSGAIASGVDATLAALRRTLGREAAEEVASKLQYPHTRFLDEPGHVFESDLGVLARASFGRRLEVAVTIHPGVSELALGSVFDTYPLTGGHHLLSVGATREPLRSRNGLWFVPRYAEHEVPRIDRVIVPGTTFGPTTLELAAGLANTHGARLSMPHIGGGFAYDGPLAELGREDGVRVAHAVANNLDYPTSHLWIVGPTWPSSLVLAPLLALLGLAGALLVQQVRRRFRRAAGARGPAPSAMARRPASVR